MNSSSESAAAGKQHHKVRAQAQKKVGEMRSIAHRANLQSSKPFPGEGLLSNALDKVCEAIDFIIDDVLLTIMDGIFEGLRKLFSKLLVIFDMDTPEKLEEAKTSIASTCKNAGKQAASAAVITLLTALANGAKDGIGGMLETSKKNVQTSFGPSQQGSLWGDDDDWDNQYRRPARSTPPSYPGSYSSGRSYSSSSSNPWDRV